MDNPWDLEVIIRLRNIWCFYSSIAVLWLVARYSNLQWYLWYGYNRFVRRLVEAPLGSAPDRIGMFIVITNVIGGTIYDSCVVRAIPTHSLKSFSNSLTIIYSNLLSSAKVLGFPTWFSIHYFLKSHTNWFVL